MILVDTAVWIDHFRKNNSQLKVVLAQGLVATHPLIIGELACGNFKQRDNILSWLRDLPTADPVNHDEILYFIEERRLMGLGIGIVDIHLLASAIISNFPLWTIDKRLRVVAKQLDVHYETTPTKN